ncbi:MAG: carboxylesterase/lipase family protein [Gammaproteobacteria bacterium]|nr:carboxylesterase/lipase family protein [Gammaproteobacteria bacterium]MYJ76212.1 carboxylesterase/lipase family protein [Gammaproteobacteria bacterium]
MRRRQVLAASGAAVVAAGIPGHATQTPMYTPTVTLSSGKVRGRIVDGVHRFLGIPYAEPPFAEHRFVAPVPRSRWDGVLDAGEYGAICPQTGGVPGGNEPDNGEDCLNLNVWTPDPGAKGLPVMVWVHGGGQVAGSGAAAYYDGTHFAKSGVVLITNNRRLGAEGYLYLAERFGEGIGPGNLGILDQIEVLRWVQENVERFGGDPGNVTLFGESGGGAATQAVVATTGSKGCCTGSFRRAVGTRPSARTRRVRSPNLRSGPWGSRARVSTC